MHHSGNIGRSKTLSHSHETGKILGSLLLHSHTVVRHGSQSEFLVSQYRAGLSLSHAQTHTYTHTAKGL